MLVISYARQDAAVVHRLHDDLEQAHLGSWFDQDLQGGQQWWDAILARIRDCDLFVFALSPTSVQSKACCAELSYATALHKPILPVMVRTVNVDLAPDPIGATQIVDYRKRTPETVIDLVAAAARELSPPLPDELPEPPGPPIADLGPVRDRLAADHLDFAAQQVLAAELKRLAADPDLHQTLGEMAEQFLRRADLAVAVKQDLDALVASLPQAEGVAEAWGPGSGEPERSLADLGPDTVDLLRSLVTHIRSGRCTPIIGSGMTDSLIGPRRMLSREWAESFDFPTQRRRADDLPGAAQFITVMTDADTLRSTLAAHVASHVRDRYEVLLGDEPGDDPGALVRAAWLAQRGVIEADPHAVLARLPCPIYVVAHPWDLMAEALRHEGRDPVVDLCRWRPDVHDWPRSVWDGEPDYVPTVDRPLVYHVFGTMDVPESLVLSEDDYFDFLISVTEDHRLVPTELRSVLADSALLLIGFGLRHWDTRVLLRTLVSQEGSHRLAKYTHVAAQLERRSAGASPGRERRYLERLFGKRRTPSIDIFWGSVAEFAADLAEIWETTQ